MSTIDPAISIVVPVRNEAGNIAPLVAEIARALDGQWPFEVVYVNDGSTDGTDAELARLMTQHPWLRRVRHQQSCGQSSAVRSGVAAARAPLVATLDGDGQNDPAFIPALVRALGDGCAAGWAGCRATRRAQGERVQKIPVAHRQCRARRRVAGRHARHRLRAESVSSRCVSELAIFRWIAPFPAGAREARGIRHCLCRRGRPSTRPRRFQLRDVGSALGRHS